MAEVAEADAAAEVAEADLLSALAISDAKTEEEAAVEDTEAAGLAEPQSAPASEAEGAAAHQFLAAHLCPLAVAAAEAPAIPTDPPCATTALGKQHGGHMRLELYTSPAASWALLSSSPNSRVPWRCGLVATRRRVCCK